MLSPQEYGFEVQLPTVIPALDYLPMLGLGIIAALAGIGIMYGVTLAEQAFRATRVPAWLRPAVGGLAVASLAMASPQVLSAGHAALAFGLDAPYPLRHLALLFLLKAAASAISLGSGFRGGLFFASLFLGALIGKLFAGLLAMATITYAVPPVVLGLVGMSALAVAIVGGPLTMAFLALESTGSLPLTVAVMLAAVVSSITVRAHLRLQFRDLALPPARRGDPQRRRYRLGAQPDGRADDAPRGADGARRHDARRVPSRRAARRDRRAWWRWTRRTAMPASCWWRRRTPRMPTSREAADHPALRRRHAAPQMTVKDAASLFEHAEADALAVVDNPDSRRVIGLLTEAYALRRYSEELERRRKELSGE